MQKPQVFANSPFDRFLGRGTVFAMLERLSMRVLSVIGLSVGTVLVAQAADKQSPENQLIRFYQEHQQRIAKHDGEALRKELLSVLPSDRDINFMFLKHADLAREQVAARKADLKMASAEKLREYKARIVERGAITSIRPREDPLIMVLALKQQEILRSNLVAMALMVDTEQGTAITKEFASVKGRWVMLPNIATAIRHRNLGGVPQPDIKAFHYKVIRDPAALARELESGVDPNTRSKDAQNEPLLWRAVRLRSIETVRLLLSRGARVDERSASFKKTALFQAAYDGSADIARLLLDSGADPNALDMYDNNPLREAILAKWPAMVRLLLQHGANPNQLNKDGESMIDIAAKHGTPKIEALLKGNDS